MNRKNILSILDIASFVCLIVATVLVFVFEGTGTESVLKAALYMFEVCLLVLLAFSVMRIIFVFKKEDNKDSEFVLSKKEKIWLFVRLGLSLIAFCVTSVILIIF